MDNKNIFAANLNYFMKLKGKTRKEVSDAIGVSYFTFSDWCNGKKYPRMDKVEILSNYFGVLKSDLIEDKTEERKEMQKNNDVITDIIVRMRTDSDFLSAVMALDRLEGDKYQTVLKMLSVLGE